MNFNFKWNNPLALILILLAFSSCGLYTSSDRKKFESDNPTPPSAELSHLGLINTYCSHESLAKYTTNADVILEFDSKTQQPLVLRHLLIQGRDVYESDNLQGVFCVQQPEQNN
jgi:hypothetical protein